MKRAVYVLTIINLIWLIIIMTDNFEFEKPSQASVYPPSVDFKQAVEATINDILADKIFDTIWKKTFHWITVFESLDGFNFNAGATQSTNGSYVQLATSAVLNNEVEINKQPSWQGLITFSQRSYFRSNIYFNNTTNQTIYLTVGNKDTTNYYGFKIIDANLYGVSYDGTTEKTILLTTITATNYNLEARYLPSNKIVFLVESLEIGVITTNLPLPVTTSNVQLMDIRIKTTATAIKTIQVSFFEYLQVRNILQ